MVSHLPIRWHGFDKFTRFEVGVAFGMICPMALLIGFI
jgi:hypothetical protein